MPALDPEKQNLVVERTRQLFRFLKAYAERRMSLKRTLQEHDWTLRLRDLPKHPAIVVGQVLLNDPGAGPAGTNSNEALLTVRRPRLTNPPAPPKVLEEWLEGGWQDPDGQIRTYEQQNVRRGNQTLTESFGIDPARIAALADWRARWNAWAIAERPARAAMKAFERLYQLYSRIRLESERVELMIGDGQLRWLRDAERIDHPVLLQSVQLEFDAEVPEMRLIDADRAPELYVALLDSPGGMAPEQMSLLRQDLEKRGFHPLERDATDGFLRRLAQLLGPRGTFQAVPVSEEVTSDPVIGRDPVLFLRQRVLGYAAAFDRVLKDLDSATAEIPSALVRLMGIEPVTEVSVQPATHSPWGEPPDILLSKPANSEQVAIARALETHHAVQVQGPPGTGKSHTIANLIGHLVAQGKRVLVTSHTTKALSVLRQHIVEQIRPLAVSVLDNDLEGRAQMEEAVRQILTKLTESSTWLAGEVERLTIGRKKLNASIEEVTAQLELARAAEYRPIVVGGAATPPSQAARWVRENRTGNDWIPSRLSPGAPIPMSQDEVAELCSTTASLSAEEEAEIETGIPSAGVIPSHSAFATLVAQAADSEEGGGKRYWDMNPEPSQIDGLSKLERLLVNTREELQRLTPWERELVRVGYQGGTDVSLWQDLCKQIRSAHSVWDVSKPLMLEFAPNIPNDTPASDLASTYEEIRAHVTDGGSLGWLSLVTRGVWKETITHSRVNGQTPTEADHFRALKAAADIQISRERLQLRWTRLGVPAGLPEMSSLGSAPEVNMMEYAQRVELRLTSWHQWRSPIEESVGSVGLRWRKLREDAVTHGGTTDPFQRELDVLSIHFPRLLVRRLAACRAMRANHLLQDIQNRLSSFRGPATTRLFRAIEARDLEAYAIALPRCENLRTKSASCERRQVLLAKLRPTAPAWSDAIKRRQGLHGNTVPPGNAAAAWQWRQLHDELERRSVLDEHAMSEKLAQLREGLRAATAELIESKAWSAQVARVDLDARQALQGWADTQSRIGRGTGRRVPELQAHARRLLEQARQAVPIWIMPLSRVAESFQPSSRRFDVVIVDEASQSDVTGLLAWYLGDRVLVVGDDEQVSPLDVGQNIGATAALISQHLSGIPNAHLYDGRASIYNLAGQSFGGTIRLREHFRCMPAIIDFSNRLSYGGEIRALRNPASVDPPHVVEYACPSSLGGRRDGKRNEAEARMLVALFKAMTEAPSYRDKTFGAISLLGDEQAGLIQELALQVVGAVELEARRFAAGSAAQFQGDERDVMLLSMVDTSTGVPLALRQSDIFKQRYNVAASRAKDQLWLVHSLDPERDLKDGDLRRELIAHSRDPEARLRNEREALARAESPFEEEVMRRLMALGYVVKPQVWVGNYRIDMVVGSGQTQLAIECDGDRFHGVDKIPADMARQAILERAGWRFVRIRGTRFFRDPDSTMNWVKGELERLGTKPSSAVPSSPTESVSPLRASLERRAWEIMTSLGWVPSAEGTAAT